MTLCQHDDCDREGIAAWNGCVFCDEHVRERLRTTADGKLLARVAELEAALRKHGKHDPNRCFVTAGADSDPKLVCNCGLEAALACLPSRPENLSIGSALSDDGKGEHAPD